ncbi:MAG TPA: O-antigen ligase family protein [Dokdonella sp.]|uniref:O-antigen ligase family protein n=1 Tax=Dokdonella sp. TaxID=2291710 RepID=UPI002D7F3C32|nr:O-antigen ligase family protein [Dokdonella sp.]HET9034279.1 O-antigen ligase family protein [Dokdonella sp.]
MNTLESMRRGELGALLIVLAVLILLPVGRTSELPILIGGLIGIGLLLRHRIEPLAGPGLRLTLVLFACYWIPVFLSAFSAVMAQKSWMTALEILRFLPFALFVAWALRKGEFWQPFLGAVAAVSALWIIDAWVQIVGGYSLAGAPELNRISGIFGAGNLKLGPVLAVLSPFLLLAAREKAGRWGLLLAFIFVLVPILMSGSRAAWLSFALVTLAFGWRETRSFRRFFPLLLGALLGVALCAGLILRDSERFDSRIERSLLVFQGTEQAIDEASAGRLRIWSAAIDMIKAHPLSGVGARGFRYDYAEHASAGDDFVDAATGTGASHAHQIVLEVLTETGLIGLIFWIAGGVYAIRTWRRATTDQQVRAFAPGLALAVMCFPLNTHFAFYSAWWGLFFWWLLAIFCAALTAGAKQAEGNPADQSGGSDKHRP